MERTLKPKHLVLLTLAVSAFAQGVCGQLFYPNQDNPHSDLVFFFADVILMFLWYRLDSDEHAYRRTFWLNFCVVALALFAFPYYFFRTRGAARGFIAIGLFLACGIATALLVFLGQHAVYNLQS